MHCRRALHVPFWPLASSPPAPETPSSSPTPTTIPQQSFFPTSVFPPPPQPPEVDTWQNTVPANISSLTFPGSGSASAPPSRHSSKVAAAVLLPLLAFAVLAAGAAFFLHRRRSRLSYGKDDARSDSQRLFPYGSPASDGGAVPRPARHGSSDSPYVDTRRSGIGSSDRKFWSPELRPLPPLPRQFLQENRSEEPADSSEQNFYSPRVSSVWKGSSGRMESARISSSRRTFPAMVEKCESRGSTLSTPPYPASPVASTARFGSSPAHSGRKSLKATCETTLTGDRGFIVPQRPPPTSPAAIGDSSHGLQALHPPPPPPPLPPMGYWENQVRRPKVSEALPYPFGADTKQTTEAIEKNDDTARPKLKPLHWDKLQASSNRAMVWDQLRSSSYRVNEEMIETLFVCNPNTSSAQRETDKVQVLPRPPRESRVLDPKKSQNISILMKALSVTKEEICAAILEGNAESLGSELLETLQKVAPSKEEERKLKELKEGDSPFKLGPAEEFLKSFLNVPFWFKRVEAMIYLATFASEVNFLKESFDTLEEACVEIRSSRLFLKLLEAVLKTGNHMNVGTNRGGAHAFKLDTLLKLVDVKGTDGKTTLLHFVTQEIIRSEGSSLAATSRSPVKTPEGRLQDELQCRKLGLEVVAGIGGELSKVKKAAAMDYNTLGISVSKLAGGIGRIYEVLRLNEALGPKEFNRRFQEAMDQFLRRAEDGIISVQAQESIALSLVKETTEYFHGNSAKEEAHPFRIFMVVRDFLVILDKICKEIGRTNEQTIVSSVRNFPVPVNPTLSPLFSRFHPLRPEISGEESSLSL